ncbi:MAG: hypothetical protein ACK5EA_00685 [Planctomycetaceae bacterium]
MPRQFAKRFLHDILVRGTPRSNPQPQRPGMLLDQFRQLLCINWQGSGDTEDETQDNDPHNPVLFQNQLSKSANDQNSAQNRKRERAWCDFLLQFLVCPAPSSRCDHRYLPIARKTVCPSGRRGKESHKYNVTNVLQRIHGPRQGAGQALAGEQDDFRLPSIDG